MGLETDEDVMK